MESTGKPLEPRLWIVGEGPPTSTWARWTARHDPAVAMRLSRRLALTGAVGKRLAGLLDEPWPAGLVPWRDGGRRYVLRNLQDVPWSVRPYQVERMRARGLELLAEARAEGSPVLALGLQVAEALGIGDEPFCSWTETADGLVGLLPHPSTRSRWWNPRENAEEALAFLRAARAGLEHRVSFHGEGGWYLQIDPRTSLLLEDRTRAEAIERGLLALEGSTYAPKRFWTARHRLVESGTGFLKVQAWLSRHARGDPASWDENGRR